jgi:Cu+-exporting ATPase
LAGVIAIADPIKSSTRAALDDLRKDGIRIVMVTGDNKATALAVAKKLGIQDVEADVLPEDKNKIIKRLKRKAEPLPWPGMA